MIYIFSRTVRKMYTQQMVWPRSGYNAWNLNFLLIYRESYPLWLISWATSLTEKHFELTYFVINGIEVIPQSFGQSERTREQARKQCIINYDTDSFFRNMILNWASGTFVDCGILLITKIDDPIHKQQFQYDIVQIER